ncbi:MAG: hypothetical protein M5U28_27530 [Sandaracinaceae bacterium]|nr:hypothetical protein [Sandaracinaceae bacterium]
MVRVLRFAPLALLLLASPALAQTTIAGGNIINQTWTPAGSPYRINGDVIVPNGAYLDIQAGTVIEVATSDGLGAGENTAEVEITIHGQLHVTGTASEPVIIRGVGSGTNAWYGILIASDATDAVFQHAQIEGGHLRHPIGRRGIRPRRERHDAELQRNGAVPHGRRADPLAPRQCRTARRASASTPPPRPPSRTPSCGATRAARASSCTTRRRRRRTRRCGRARCTATTTACTCRRRAGRDSSRCSTAS